MADPIIITITVDEQGNISLSPSSWQVPNTQGTSDDPAIIIWKIQGAGNAMFLTNPPGIQLTSGVALPFVAGAPVGYAQQYVLVDLNNSDQTWGQFQYTVNYLFNGQPRSADPMIDNQPPQ